MTYGTDAAATHLSNAYLYHHTNDMQTSEPSFENLTFKANLGIITRWNRLSASREIQLFGQLHSDTSNVPLCLLPVVRLQIRLT